MTITLLFLVVHVDESLCPTVSSLFKGLRIVLI